MRAIDNADLPSRPATPSPILMAAPQPPRQRPYGLRRLAVTAIVGALVVLVLSVSQHWYAIGGPGDAIYWAHDTLFLPVKGWLWTALFPVGALMWVTAAAVLLALVLLSYLFDVDAIRGVQTALIRWGCERHPKRVVSLFRLGQRVRMRGALILFLSRARLDARLAEVRDGLRQPYGETTPSEDRLIQDLHLVIALEAEAPSAESEPALRSIAALAMAVHLTMLIARRNGSPIVPISGATNRQDGKDLDRLVRAQIKSAACEQRPMLTQLLGLLIPQDLSAQHGVNHALRQEIIERSRALMRLSNQLDQGEGRAARTSEMDALGSDGYAALASLLLAAIVLGLRAGDDVSTLRFALDAIHAVERLAIAAALRTEASSNASIAVLASAALADIDARLHAAAFAQTLDEALTSSHATWDGIVDVRDRAGITGLAVAAARDVVELGTPAQ
jgi:hypothetical protein